MFCLKKNRIMPFVDLKLFSLTSHSLWTIHGGLNYVRWQARFLSGHGTFTAPCLSSVRCSLQWQLQGQDFYLPRPVSLYGICPTDIPREPAGYRSLSSCTEEQALSHGDPWSYCPQHSGQRQQKSRLAYLRRPGSFADQDSPSPLSGRRLWFGVRKHRLCTRCHEHRALPVGISLGTVQTGQGSCQVAHIAGFEWQYSYLHPYLRRQTKRSQCLGRPLPGSRRFLRNGSRVSRLRSTLSPQYVFGIFCHPSQEKHALSPTLFSPRRPVDQLEMRPDSETHGILFSHKIPGQASQGEINRPRDRKDHGLSNQQLSFASADHHRIVPLPMAGRAVLQVDQAKPADQNVLWNFRERCQSSGLDCCLRVRSGRHYEKAA